MVGMTTLTTTAYQSHTPSYKEVLKAISILKKHVDLDSDPCSRKLDAILNSFRYKLHIEQSKSMGPTLITDFFRCTSS